MTTEYQRGKNDTIAKLEKYIKNKERVYGKENLYWAILEYLEILRDRSE